MDFRKDPFQSIQKIALCSVISLSGKRLEMKRRKWNLGLRDHGPEKLSSGHRVDGKRRIFFDVMGLI